MVTPPDPILFGVPMMPDRKQFDTLIDTVFSNRRLTNVGPLHDRLEAQLSTLFGAEAVLTSSGAMALMLALHLGDLRPNGAVITTPLSFAASVQAIEWCGLRPVFADVEADHPTLDPAAVERAITPETVAILAVHFEGIACDIAGLEDVARRHGLWLVFDAAQAPDVQRDGRSLALAGDATALSLHATKLLNTAEGGVVVTRDPAHTARLRRMRNFGLTEGRMAELGTNGKLSELHAAFGLALLPRLPGELALRRDLRRIYHAALPQVPVLAPRPGSSESHLYFTLSLPPSLCHRTRLALEAAAIRPRAAFPLLCGAGTRHASAEPFPQAEKAVARHLSLPLHGGIDATAARRMTGVIAAALSDEFNQVGL